ncbi:MAG: DUF1501 domain-containing protein [Bdellovibrionales bacterium]
MLRFDGNKHNFCDGVDRRSFLQIGAFGAGLTLADMLRAKSLATENNRPSRQKSAIMIFLAGGPSHMDMYDLKPEAPSEFRGEFRPIQTNVPGCQICEHFPLQAQMWDKLAAIRSIVSVNEHSDSLIMTGHANRELRTRSFPSFGSVISKLRSGQSTTVPHFVSLRGMTRGTEPGYLGVAHRPFTPNGPGLANLQMARGINKNRLTQRRTLLDSFDNIRQDIDASGTLQGMDSFHSHAFDIVTSGGVRTALDLSRETPQTRQRYRGLNNFLQALRLVEAGVGCVTLSIGGWDTHGNNFRSLRQKLPLVDRGVANLVRDLHERGLGNDVITVLWGEFGRTPRVNRNAGRDHWPSVMSAMIAGGGLRMGQMVGSSNSRGERPTDGRCTPSQVLSTIYQAMGVDASRTFEDNTGRPRYILDDRETIPALL